MNCPKITSAKAVSDRVLHVRFADGAARNYDISQLLERPMFAPLTNPALFKAVSVEPGGYAVSWGGEIDLSEYELWQGGESVPSTANMKKIQRENTSL